MVPNIQVPKLESIKNNKEEENVTAIVLPTLILLSFNNLPNKIISNIEPYVNNIVL